MSEPTVFDRNPCLAKPQGRTAWAASFAPVLSELREAVAARSPAWLSALSGAEWDEAAAELRMALLGRAYRITWPELAICAQEGDDAPSSSVQGLLLFYLSLADGAEPAGAWFSFRELPDGWLYHQAFQSYTGHVLVQTLGDDVAAFAAAAQAAGGEETGLGDAGYAFQALPKVRLAMVFWQGDDEFGPEAQVLFDAASSHYLPIDGLAALGSRLVQRIVECAA